MRDDRRIEISRAHPNQCPAETIPERDPMQMPEGTDHERIEGENHRADNHDDRRQTPERRPSPDGGFKGGESAQKKPAEIDLDGHRNYANEPGNHDENGHVRMRSVRQEGDIPSPTRKDAKNDERVHTAQDESGEDAKRYSLAPQRCLQADPLQDWMI